jgi:ABC-type nitrate/sulfonate/bicarbonate transport system permease component
MKLLNQWPGVVLLFALLAFWETAARLGWMTPEQLPAPTVIFKAGIDGFRNDDLAVEVLTTARRLVISYLLAVVVAIPAGFALGRWRLAYAAFGPLIEFLRPMPVVAILPIAAFMLGLNDRMCFTVIAFSSGWIVLLHAMDGLRGVDPVLVDTGRTFGVSGLRQFFTILLPAASPNVFTGLRLGLGIAVVITVVVELATGFDGGLGAYVATSQGSMLVPETYVGIFLIGLLGYAIGQTFLAFEGRMMRWHRGSRGY